MSRVWRDMSLNMIKKVDVIFNPIFPCKGVRHAMVFHDRVCGPKLRKTNPACDVSLIFTKAKEPVKIQLTWLDGSLSSVNAEQPVESMYTDIMWESYVKRMTISPVGEEVDNDNDWLHSTAHLRGAAKVKRDGEIAAAAAKAIKK